MHPDPSEENFAVFIVAEQMCEPLTTLLQLMAIPHMWTEETKLNDEAKKQACVKVRNYESIKLKY